MKNYVITAMLAGMTLVSCKKTTETINDPQTTNPIAPDGFNYSTQQNVALDVQLLTNSNEPLKSVLVNFYAVNNAKKGHEIYTALTDANGAIKGAINIPSYVDTLLIDPAYAGLLRYAKAPVKGGGIQCIIGGSDGYSGDVVPNDNAAGDKVQVSAQSIDNGLTGKYSYMALYDAYGRPGNLSTSDNISAELLSWINASLPESRPVPTYHPDYMAADASNNLDVKKTTDVYLTFVSEGAGNLNSLGFYTYTTGNPPKKTDDIESIKLVVPNASLYGSGGNMRSGDRIKLGTFTAGTSIGFVLFQNGWTGYMTGVNTDATKFYTTDALNTESAGFKKHSVVLYDQQNKLFLQGFEDLQRDNGSSDEDFNDVIFYITHSATDAISTSDIKPIDKPSDKDGDGVNDTYDDFPTDPARAYIKYFPAESTWGTLAFEDLWPATGDYDLNDLVVGYRYKFINDSKNQTIEMYGDYALRATGASFINGFGVQLPFAYSKVSSVTGQKQIAKYIQTNSNGTEAGQTKAVIIPFDDTRALIKQGGFTNVNNGSSYFTSDTASVYIKFTTGLSASELGTAPFNPFVISNQRRGYEVHLPGSVATDKADTKLFGTADDKTNPATGKYYLNGENWPWAISILETFDYPSENNNVSKAYVNFLNWAKSGGALYPDWYTNAGGNRNEGLIYKK